MPEPEIPIPLPFPIRGLDRGSPAAEQPPLTTSDLLNVRALNANDRMGGGKRGGSKKAFAQQLGDATDGRRVNRMGLLRLSSASFGCVPRSWGYLGTGVNGPVHRLIGHNPTTLLHAVGAFTTAGGATADRHAMFSTLPTNTTSAWSAAADAFDTSMDQPCGLLSHTDDYLYLAGGFDATLNWFTRTDDGTSWSDLNFGNTGVTSVNCLGYFTAPDQIIVGGEFSEAGGVACANITAYNLGSQDYEALGVGVGAKVLAVCEFGGKMYVGGRFTDAGGVARNYLASWDGAAWATVATNDLDARVTALCSFGGYLYIGGWFTTAGSSTRNSYITRLNSAGTAFEPLVYGLQSRDADATDGGVYSMEVYNDGSGDKLLVCGKFHRASNNGGGVACANIAMWDGSQWLAPKRGANKIIYHGVGIGSSLRKKVHIGGTMTLKDIVPAPGLCAWGGSEWESLGGAGLRYGYNNVDGTTAGSTTEGRYKAALCAGVLVASQGVERMICGSLYTAGTAESNVHGFGPKQVDNAIAEWDGASWLPMNGGLSGAGAHPRCAVLHNDGEGVKAFIGGYFTSAGGVTGSPNAMFYNGEAWEAMGTGVSSGSAPVNCAFSLKTTPYRGLYVGGAFAAMGGVANTAKLAKWTGTAWEAAIGSFGTVSGGLGEILAIMAYKNPADDKTYLFCGGQFTTVDATAGYNNLFSIDLSTTPADADPFGANAGITKGGSATSARVNAMAVFNDELYVAGDFDSVDANGTPLTTCNNIVKFDGTNWEYVGNGASNNGTNAAINALLTMQTPNGPVLVVMGNFSTAGANSRKAIATWDGDKWDKLDSTQAAGLGMGDFTTGLSRNDRGDVQAGCIFKGRLCVTGNFYHAEGRDDGSYLYRARCGGPDDYSNGNDPGTFGPGGPGGGGPGGGGPTGGPGGGGGPVDPNTEGPSGTGGGLNDWPQTGLGRLGDYSELDYTGGVMVGTIDAAGVSGKVGIVVAEETAS